MRSFFKIFSRGESTTLDALPLPEARFAEMLFSVEDREIRPRLAPLLDLTKAKSGAVGIEIAPRLPSFAAFLKEKGVGFIAGIGTPKEREAYGHTPASFLLAHWESLPLLDASADVALIRTAFLKGGFNRVVHEAARVLKPKGIAVVTDLHPFSPMVQEAHFKKPAGEEGLGPGFERYYKAFRDGNLQITAVAEVFFDGSLKKFFGSEAEKRGFERIRRHPFLILFLLAKEG